MKQQLKKWIAVITCMLFVFAGMAQQNKKLPGWLPENGYWVVESNLHSPKNHIVRFYTLDNVLIYSEKISGTKLNINKRKVKMKLKEVLELSVTAWNKNKYPVLLRTGLFSINNFRLLKSNVYRQIHRRMKSF